MNQYIPGFVALIVVFAIAGAWVALWSNRRDERKAAEQRPAPDAFGFAAAPRPVRTWHVLMDGVGAAIVRAETQPPRAVLMVRDPLHWQFALSDYLVLGWPGGSSTRYLVLGLRRAAGTCYVDCVFAPRGDVMIEGGK